MVERILFEASPKPGHLTGGTNFSEGEIYGRAKRVIVVADECRWHRLFETLQRVADDGGDKNFAYLILMEDLAENRLIACVSPVCCFDGGFERPRA
jgi:hypothetical protein